MRNEGRTGLMYWLARCNFSRRRISRPRSDVSTCNLKPPDINANEEMRFRSPFSRALLVISRARQRALLSPHRTVARFSPVFDGTSANSFRDVDKTADEEFLFPRMSRDERKCRRAAIDPGLGLHLLPAQINLRSAITSDR